LKEVKELKENTSAPWLSLEPWQKNSEAIALSVRLEKFAGTELRFQFKLSGNSSAVLIPSLAAEIAETAESEKTAGKTQRRDDLWKQTCLELFIGSDSVSSYFEMNLSPSGSWNFYLFDSYRSGMRRAGRSEMVTPLESVKTESDSIIWSGSLAMLDLRADLPAGLDLGTLVISATAVMQYQDGRIQYWALRHAGQKPDFHLRESFIVKL
jgi:hypothetical protein